MSHESYQSHDPRARHPQSADLHDRAPGQLTKRRDLRGHVLIYLLVNTFLVVIWWVSSGGFFWPVFPIIGWGIGVTMNAYDVYVAEDIPEDDIQREMEHLSRQ